MNSGQVVFFVRKVCRAAQKLVEIITIARTHRIKCAIHLSLFDYDKIPITFIANYNYVDNTAGDEYQILIRSAYV